MKPFPKPNHITNTCYDKEKVDAWLQEHKKELENLDRLLEMCRGNVKAMLLEALPKEETKP